VGPGRLALEGCYIRSVDLESSINVGWGNGTVTNVSTSDESLEMIGIGTAAGMIEYSCEASIKLFTFSVKLQVVGYCIKKVVAVVLVSGLVYH
jgi:hypothetical protein